MRRITVTNNISLDGVMQAPMSPDEDTRGGFALGGWALGANADPELGAEMGKGMAQTRRGRRDTDGRRAEGDGWR